MPDRANVLAAIDSAYAAREAGDKEALARHFAPFATFHIAGRKELLGFDVGPVDAMSAIGELIDLFTFHRMERLHVVIDGDVAVIRWRIEVSASDGVRETTELCDIWTFDDDAKARSLVEFADTALIARMLARVAG
jgi:ketosteroid isomerase-like protein